MDGYHTSSCTKIINIRQLSFKIYEVKLRKLLHTTRHFRYCCFRAT